MLGRIIAHTGLAFSDVDVIATDYPRVFRSLLREVEMIRQRQMAISSQELT